MPEMMAPAAPGMPAPPVTTPPGPTGPATVPPQQDGRRQQGYIQANIAITALERAAGLFGGSMTDEGREILTAVLKLRKKFGTAAPDLQKQELKSLAEHVAPVQSPSPMQGQAFQQAIRQRQQAQGMPAPTAA